MVSNQRCFIFLVLLFTALSARAQSYYYAYYQPQSYPYYRSVSADSDSPRAAVIQGGSRPTVRGNRAVVRHGVAYAPANAPDAVKSAIWAANSLRRMPYKWGGGHGSFCDRRCDCRKRLRPWSYFTRTMAGRRDRSSRAGRNGNDRSEICDGGPGHQRAALLPIALPIRYDQRVLE